MTETKIIAIDDDPTGSQTVHGCLLLTRWDVQTLTEALRDESPLFFVLSNTRGMSAADAATVTREICVNLRAALDEMAEQGTRIQPVIVSRSDSTLRGHYPVETDVIAEELGPFDAHFLVPAFFEGGRITRDGVHYLDRRRCTGAGARDRVRAGFGVRLQHRVFAGLCRRKDRWAYQVRPGRALRPRGRARRHPAAVARVSAVMSAARSTPSSSRTWTTSAARCWLPLPTASAFCSAAPRAC